MSGLEILDAGPIASIQDQGRLGCAHLGITQSGAIDPFSWRLGQRLVGNTPPEAALEFALGGLSVRAHAALTIAVTGISATATIEDVPCDLNRAIALPANSVLKVSYPARGNYGYLAVAGTLDISSQFGSKATTYREGLGLFAGRQLQAGDVISISATHESGLGQCYRQIHRAHKNVLRLRYVPGFQARACAGAKSAFENQTFKTTSSANRMGVRLEGPALAMDIVPRWSEAACLGAIQVPPDGQPIVLLNEFQTMGGYPKLGAVLSTDCARLAQAKLGQRLQFVPVTPSEADRILWLERSYEAEQRLSNSAR